MKKTWLPVVIMFCCTLLSAQEHSSSNIFAHNDYVQSDPLNNAYKNQVGYVEADIFLAGNVLLVAHTDKEIDKSKTLENLYLKPLEKKVAENKGSIYTNARAPLTLMIDLKSDGPSTLAALVKLLQKYPTLLAATNFQVTVSGSVPNPSTWNTYPEFIHFDGRPNIEYTPEQLKRISLISTSFKDHSKWDGKGVLEKGDEEKIKTLIDAAHRQGKKIRFWAIPDFNNAWIVLMRMGVDVINTDHVSDLSAFLKKRKSTSYLNTDTHEVYSPRNDFSRQPPKNIILLIGDGMGLAQLYSGYTANRGKLNIFTIRDLGLSITMSSDSYITDSAAGATAMASGKKTNNRFIGVDANGDSIVPVTRLVKDANYKVGLISSGDITDATPAAFYAHERDRSSSAAIAEDFLRTEVDILIGGGQQWFNQRQDGLQLTRALTNKGYSVSTDFNSIDAINTRQFVLLDDSAVVSKINGRQDFLPRSLRKTIQTFDNTNMPFFIMAEGAQIDWGGHANNMEYMVREMLDFDKAVGEALKFADENEETLVIITADHETGGLTLLDGSSTQGYVHGNFSTTDHTAVMVPVFAYGPGAEFFRGVYQNTDIFHKIVEVLRLGN